MSNYKAKRWQLKEIIWTAGQKAIVFYAFLQKLAPVCQCCSVRRSQRDSQKYILTVLAFFFFGKMVLEGASPLYFSNYQALLQNDSLMSRERTAPCLRVYFQKDNQIQRLEHIDENWKNIRSEVYHYDAAGKLSAILAYDSARLLIEEKRFNFSNEELHFLRFFFGEDFYAETEASFAITRFDTIGKPFERQLWQNSKQHLGMIRYFINAAEYEPAIIWYDSSRQAVREGFKKGRSIRWRRVWDAGDYIDD